MKNWKYIVGTTLLFFLFFSCENPIVEPYETFIIPKGKHSAGMKVQSLQSQSLRFKALFNETAIYDLESDENQHDTNKLYGFSDCNSHHHINSARFGWMWHDGKLEIHAYVYAGGERTTEYIGTVPLNESREYELVMSDSYYHFNLQGFDQVSIERKASCDIQLSYLLFPYFGGDEVAPHDIIIKILTIY